MSLHQEKCVPCEGGVKPYSREEAEKLLTQVSKHWSLATDKDIQARLKFKDFAEAMKFVNNVAELAEGQGHHPDIMISYNKVALTLTTHAINGLSRNDFILASKIDLLLGVS